MVTVSFSECFLFSIYLKNVLLHFSLIISKIVMINSYTLVKHSIEIQFKSIYFSNRIFILLILKKQSFVKTSESLLLKTICQISSNFMFQNF